MYFVDHRAGSRVVVCAVTGLQSWDYVGVCRGSAATVEKNTDATRV